MLDTLYNRISNGRSLLMFKNILASVGIKGWSFVVQLLIVPLSLDCLTNYEFGIWLTLNSIFAWIDNCDIGLGNGLRNKLSEALALGDKILAKKLITTTFISLFAISCILYAVFSLLLASNDIYQLLNVEREIVPNLSLVCYLLFATICLTFVAKGLNSIFWALQMPAITNLIQAIGSTLSLIAIAIMAHIGLHSFIVTTMMYTALPLISYAIFGWYFFFHKDPQLCPNWAYFEPKQIKPLMSLGIKFFIGQIAGVILLFTSNIIISRVISPDAVTSYQVVTRYFSMILIPATIILTPIWSATTDAYVRGEIEWIKSIFSKFRWGLILLLTATLLMIILSNWFFSIWIKDKVQIDSELIVAVAIYTFVFVCGTFYTNIIFGLGKVSLTISTVSIMAVLFVILAMPITRLFGVIGLIYLQTIIGLINTFQKIIQTKLILANKAKGFLNK